MHIALSQLRPIKGDVTANIKKHVDSIEMAVSKQCDAIFFSELSITSYEPELTQNLAFTMDDKRLKVFQEKSNKHQITIGVGVPLFSDDGIYIAMFIYQPSCDVQVYSKQYLHADETSFFIEGEKQILINVKGEIIAPAICYESLREEHLENAIELGATLYLASVAKPKRGVEKAISYFSAKSKSYSIPIVMVNAIGYCDNFLSYGNTSVWNTEGIRLNQLDHSKEGVLIFDTKAVSTEVVLFNN